jgi:hypothetical protein
MLWPQDTKKLWLPFNRQRRDGLYISENIFGINGLTSLTKALKSNNGLRMLWVGDNTIGDGGDPRRLAEIKYLIGKNSVGDEVAVALDEALMANDGAVALVGALTVNTSTIVLDTRVPRRGSRC